MPYSMTAFAQSSIETEIGELSCELRTVNHRFLDLAPRMPEEFRVFEAELRDLVGQKLNRGRVDCFIRLKATAQKNVTLNLAVVQRLQQLSDEINQHISQAESIRAVDILKWPDALQGTQVAAEQLKKYLLDVVAQALDKLLVSRKREGEKLAQLIAKRCDAMQVILKEIQTILPEVNKKFRQRVEDKLNDIKASVEESRIEQEIVIFMQKSDVSEEIDRLEVHIEEVRKVIEQDKPCGRRLDFLMQELNREANTLSSKSQDTQLTKACVDLKVFIEQMREQVQNIE